MVASEFFENPGAVIIAIGFLLVIVSYSVLIRFFRDRVVSLIISIVIGLIGGWYLYKERFYEETIVIFVIFIVLSIALVVAWLRPFWKYNKLNLGYR